MTVMQLLVPFEDDPDTRRHVNGSSPAAVVAEDGSYNCNDQDLPHPVISVKLRDDDRKIDNDNNPGDGKHIKVRKENNTARSDNLEKTMNVLNGTNTTKDNSDDQVVGQGTSTLLPPLPPQPMQKPAMSKNLRSQFEAMKSAVRQMKRAESEEVLLMQDYPSDAETRKCYSRTSSKTSTSKTSNENAIRDQADIDNDDVHDDTNTNSDRNHNSNNSVTKDDDDFERHNDGDDDDSTQQSQQSLKEKVQQMAVKTAESANEEIRRWKDGIADLETLLAAEGRSNDGDDGCSGDSSSVHSDDDNNHDDDHHHQYPNELEHEGLHVGGRHDHHRLLLVHHHQQLQPQPPQRRTDGMNAVPRFPSLTPVVMVEEDGDDDQSKNSEQ